MKDSTDGGRTLCVTTANRGLGGTDLASIQRLSEGEQMTDEFPPEHWELRAEEARILAERVKIPECRKIMLEIAVGYECMAEAARRFRQYGAAVTDEIGAGSLNSGVKNTLS